jgi:hypothetical protein
MKRRRRIRSWQIAEAKIGPQPIDGSVPQHGTLSIGVRIPPQPDELLFCSFALRCLAVLYWAAIVRAQTGVEIEPEVIVVRSWSAQVVTVRIVVRW